MLATFYLYLEISNTQFYLIIKKKVACLGHCSLWGLKTNENMEDWKPGHMLVPFL